MGGGRYTRRLSRNLQGKEIKIERACDLEVYTLTKVTIRKLNRKKIKHCSNPIKIRKGKIMKIFKLAVLVSVMLFVGSSMAVAGDFEWMKNLNAQASLDPLGFRARLATRFRIGDAQINAVLSNMPEPAHAYMALRLGEMSHQPFERVMEEYNKKKGKGWGVIAKNLGIKPGSAEFHALKGGHDLDSGPDKGKKDSKGKSKDKGGKSKDKGAKGRR